jgi:hypothetical protein
VRVGAIAVALAAFTVHSPAPVRAAVQGPCAVTATATSTGPVDVGSTQTWHIRSTDQVSAEGTSETPQTSVSAGVSALGFEIPIGSASSGGDRSISSDLFDASFLATVGRVFVLHGSATGASGGCEASLTVVLDDVNPFLTVLGIAGTAATLLGGVGLLRAFRNPGRRVISGLIGLALLGAGTSLLLQQTSTPDAIADVPSSPWAASVPSPPAIAVEPPFLLASALLALAVILLLPFPADLFNSTLEHNGGRIRAGLRRLPVVGGLLVRRPVAEAGVEAVTVRQHPLVIVAFLVLAAALYGFLSPAFGPDASSLLTFGGILAALLAETWFTAAPYRALHRVRDGDVGALRVVPATLIVAGACVLISRAAGFQPGYLYGLLLGFEFAKALPRADDGRAAAAGAAWMLGLGLISWFGLGAVRAEGISPSVAQSIAEAVFAALVTAGLQGSAFGMLPLRFLHGEPLFRWSRLRWSLLYLPGLLAFCAVILNPQNGFLGGSTPPFATTVALFVAFAAVSVVFWAWFRFRPGPAGSGDAASEPAPELDLAEPVIPA